VIRQKLLHFLYGIGVTTGVCKLAVRRGIGVVLGNCKGMQICAPPPFDDFLIDHTFMRDMDGY